MGISTFFSLKHLISSASNPGELDDGIAAFVTSLFEQNRSTCALALDARPRPSADGPIDHELFHDIISRPQITKLILRSSNIEDVCSVLDTLQMAIPVMDRRLEYVCVSMPLTESEAETMFEILGTISSLCGITLFLGACGEGIANPLRLFLQRPSSTVRHVVFANRLEENPDESRLVVSESAVASICIGIQESTFLQAIYMSPPDDNLDFVAESLARAMSKSTCLRGFTTSKREHLGFLRKVRNHLLQTPAVQNFELCYREKQREERLERLVFNRNAPWKPILSREVPLALWPRILERTHSWKDATSHRPLDALFYLVKEKNDVLLQNVRRRKIRKRKLFQMTA